MPAGSQFKGYPACFGHADPAEIWRALTAAAGGAGGSGGDGSGGGGGGGGSAVGLDLLATSGLESAFALRVKCYPYPEGCVATWVMLAVRVRTA